MRLSQLVAGFSITPPGADPEISGVSENSRHIGPGMVFVAVPGTSLDGHAFIADAVERGAGATTVILEVTSHALRLGRVNGLRFDGGLLAAIMPGEHTDFHRSHYDYVRRSACSSPSSTRRRSSRTMPTISPRAGS